MQDLLEATRRATADIRQKDPLAHRRRRRENRPHIPKDVHKDLLGEAGENLTEEDMKKANGLWKMFKSLRRSGQVMFTTPFTSDGWKFTPTYSNIVLSFT